jgi:predicted O-linked N-acetylglucosamine transferase (SPINDLY family)
MDENAFESAVQFHQAGRLAEAEAVYRRILAEDPGDADVCHLLGVIAKQTGRDEEAIGLLRRAIELDPEYAEAHFNLGIALAERGQLDQAIASYEKAIQLVPDYVEAHFNLANVFLKIGRLDEALASLQRAGQTKSEYARAFNNLGIALAEKGRNDDALAVYQQAIQLKPDFAEAHSNLGAALAERGDFDGAVASCNRAIELKPDYAPAHYNLGNSLLKQGRVDEAITSYRRAVQLQPDYAEAHDNLGNALVLLGQPDAAIASFERAIQLRPEFAEAYSSLGNALKEKGEIDQAIARYRRAVALSPQNPKLHSNLVYALHYDSAVSPEQILAESQQWALRHAEPLRQFMRPRLNDRDPDRRLRIGYVSPDFRHHSVSRFLLPLFSQHDHSRYEIIGYSDVWRPDGMTDRLRACADEWRNIAGLSDDRVAEMVREDRIDILVDLAGHTARNRLRVFARRPAPVQVSYLGYPGTTGLTEMDYRLSDSISDPPGQTEMLHTEKLIRLPVCNWCYDPANDGPCVAASPGGSGGSICFGSFNNFAKVSSAILDWWAAILMAVPSSRMIIKSRGLGEASVQREIRQQFSLRGVQEERLDIRGFEPSISAHLQVYNQIDIALDTFPYHGTATTCEALWMGVPVITLGGRAHVSRVGASLLTNIGLPELIAQSPQEYVRIAVNLANDSSRLRVLRSTLRQQMLRSPLMDGKRFALDVENVFRQMWQSWCLRSG